jgi:hypothetical protein
VITDPLPLLKRIRYRMLKEEFQIGVDGDMNTFMASKIQQIANVPSGVFENPRITKIHDSLPRHFFCRETVSPMCKAGSGIALFALFP